MIPTPMGLKFTDFNDLIVNYISEMGLAVDSNMYLYDQDSGNILKFKDKSIKISINGIPAYGGVNDIVFNPAHNYAICSTLFGMYINRCQDTDDGDLIQGYIAHSLEDMPGSKEFQRVVIKSIGRGEIASNYYRNAFLGFIDCTFRISGYNLDLSPFDIDYSEIQ